MEQRGFEWLRFNMEHVFSLLTVVLTARSLECTNISMSWNLRNSQLIINCTIENLHYAVSIFGPSGALQSLCSSPVNFSNCIVFIRGGHVDQSLLTNTTTFTLDTKDNSRYNGMWKCQHGSRKDRTSIKVKIFKVVQYVTQDQACYERYVTWTLIGFFPTFIICRILFWIPVVKEKMNTNLLPLRTCKALKKFISTIVCRRIVIILISSYFFMMPFIIGFVEKTRCKAPELFTVPGAVCGLFINVVCYLDENDKSDISELPPICENIPMMPVIAAGEVLQDL